jgi:hypothetical protein
MGAVQQQTKREFSNDYYGTVVTRDEGEHALHIVGSAVDPLLQKGFRYKLYKGRATEDAGALQPVFSDAQGSPVVKLTDLRPCNVPGPNYVFKVQGQDHVYTDLAIHPHGFVFFPHALSQGDVFDLVVGGSVIGKLFVKSTESIQPVERRERGVSTVTFPGIAIDFESSSKIQNGREVVYSPMTYDLQFHVVDALCGIEVKANSSMDRDTSFEARVRCSVITSSRDGAPLALSIKELITDDPIFPHGGTGVEMVRSAVGVCRSGELCHFGMHSSGNLRYGFNHGPR